MVAAADSAGLPVSRGKYSTSHHKPTHFFGLISPHLDHSQPSQRSAALDLPVAKSLSGPNQTARPLHLQLTTLCCNQSTHLPLPPRHYFLSSFPVRVAGCLPVVSLPAAASQVNVRLSLQCRTVPRPQQCAATQHSRASPLRRHLSVFTRCTDAPTLDKGLTEGWQE